MNTTTQANGLLNAAQRILEAARDRRDLRDFTAPGAVFPRNLEQSIADIRYANETLGELVDDYNSNLTSATSRPLHKRKAALEEHIAYIGQLYAAILAFYAPEATARL